MYKRKLARLLVIVIILSLQQYYVPVKKGTTVYLVNGEMESSVKKYQERCIRYGYPILYVQTDHLTKDTINQLTRIQPKRIYIVGNSTKVRNTVISQLTKLIHLDQKNIIRIKDR